MATQRKPQTTAAALVPPQPTLEKLRDAAAGCKTCDLGYRGMQTVFGAGSPNAHVMLIGEQPGNEEDLQGKPFVGPAGRILNKALQEAGIGRDEVYVTNVVKHFKWEPWGKRKIHAKPNSVEIAACMPWLEAEMEVVRPEVVVLLGATAAQAMLGRQFRVMKQRGQFLDGPFRSRYLATVHPSFILRAPDDATRHAEYAAFVDDLRKVAAVIHQRRAA